MTGDRAGRAQRHRKLAPALGTWRMDDHLMRLA